MITVNKIIGNIYSEEWLERVQSCSVEKIRLDHWCSQRSKMVIDWNGERYAITLDRHSHLKNGDIIFYSPDDNKIVSIEITLNPVMVITLNKVIYKEESRNDLIRTCIELGHAIGNQHWPAVVKENKIYVPLTLDRKVMESVMMSHHFNNIEIEFKEGDSLIPYLSPHDIRYLFSTTTNNVHHGEHH